MAEPPGRYARLELERRFLLEQAPDGIDAASERVITDRYVVGTRLRLRKVEAADGAKPSHKLGQKYVLSPPDFSRTWMTNMYLSAEEYGALAALPANEIRKRRYTLVHDGHPYSIDIFDRPLAGLVLAEISFETESELEAHLTPSFALREVSRDVRFTGSELAVSGLPAV